MKQKFDIGEKVVVVRNSEHPLTIGQMGYVKEAFPNNHLYKISIGTQVYTVYEEEIAKIKK